MPDPISFPSASPRFALPFLFAAQAQKEFFVNEALARLDGLVHGVMEGVAAAPPVSPVDGECWLVGIGPTGAWAGHAGDLAWFQAGVWLFAAAQDGMRLFDRAAGQDRFYLAGWNLPSTPAAPAGGTTIDAEARAAISAVIAALQSAGILAAS